jgi:CheY-like chemotaxis protein
MKKILVIDDEAWLREMVNMALAQKGYEVLEAEHGSLGVDVARKLLPDLILCDVNMEQMDGYGTLSSLRDEVTTASIPFILMTGLADNAGMRHGTIICRNLSRLMRSTERSKPASRKFRPCARRPNASWPICETISA